MKSLLAFLIYFYSFLATLTSQVPAFPGAEGFGALATGGRGGRVIHVTNLNIDGPGSLQDALNQSGKRYIVFDVSGVINGTVEVPPGHGDFTLAGQTSPKGIIVRGFQSYNDENPSSGNFIIRHLRSRIGTLTTLPSSNWMGSDGLTLGGVHNVIIDHCSFGQANDEAVDISRASSLTIQNCLLSETLGGHAYLGGMLINYSSPQSRLDSISLLKNNWNRIGGRMPEISCESPYCNGKTIHLDISNNLFYDPRIEMWYEGVTGSGNFFLAMNAQNNLSYCQSSYSNGMFHHDMLHFPSNQLFFSGNRLSRYPTLTDYDLFYCCNDFDTNFPNTDYGVAQRLTQRHNYPVGSLLPTGELTGYMANHVGAFPRDAMDERLMSYVQSGTFDDQPIEEEYIQDGFLIQNSTPPFPDSDLDGMPDYWENLHGLNPSVQDHNSGELSTTLTGIEGYTNLECYLNCLSDFVIQGGNESPCGIRAFTTSIQDVFATSSSFDIFPNPATDEVTLVFRDVKENPLEVKVFNALGQCVKTFYPNVEKGNASSYTTNIDITGLHGIYFLAVGNEVRKLVVR